MRKSLWLCGAMMCAHAPAMAQSDAGGKPANANEKILASDIVVTAQRRAERLVDVPVSVNSISQEELATKRIDSLGDLTKSVTSLRFEGNMPIFMPTLRGIGTMVSGGGVDASVAVYVDGVYLPNSSGMNFNLANISNMQVLKGPQGTLFGRNTTGGAILISTAEPSFTWTGTIKGTYASYNDGRLEGYISGPLSENVAASVSAYYRKGDGWLTNIVDNSHSARIKMFNIRPSLLFDNHENFKIRLIYEHNYSFDTSVLGLANVDGYAVARNVPGALISSRFGHFASERDPVNLTKTDAGTAIVDWRIDETTALKSITSYRHDSSDFVAEGDQSNLDILSVRLPAAYKTFSQELTLAKKDGPLDLVLGASYYNSKAKTGLTIYSMGAEIPIPATSVKTEAIGAFFDGTYEVSNGLFLTVGGRFSTERKELVAPFKDHARWNSFTPRAVVRYQIDSGTNVYASFSKGYKSGAYPGFPPNRVKPEKVTAFEVGFKHSSPLFDFNAAAFLNNYKDFQVTTFDFRTNTGVTINADSQRSYGFEMEAAVRPTSNWRISVAGAYLNAEFRKFPNATELVKQTIEAAPGIFVETGGWVEVPKDASGTITPRSPKWSGNVSTSYTIKTDPGQFELNANVSMSSALYNLMNEQFRNPAYADIGLGASFTPNNERWKAQIFVTNLTNKHRYAQYQGGPFGTYAIFVPPRIIGGSLSVNF